MTMHMDYQSVPGGTYTTFDLEANGVCAVKLIVSDQHPMQLTFTLRCAQHLMPLAFRWFLRFWDDAGTTPDGVAQSSTNPLFEGHVWEIEPADSLHVNYTCYDPTMIAGRETPIMSTTWLPSGGVGFPPLPDDTAVPRVIFNSTIANDPDTSFERGTGCTIGTMIAVVMDDAIYPLNWYNASPDPVGTSAYISAELDTFFFKPQAKVVSTNESIRTFIDRLTQQHYPECAFLWTPGTRLWHWYSRLTAPAETLSLNKPTTLSTGHVTNVLTMELHRSLEGRFPAVQFFGPETAGPVEVYSTLDGTLAPLGTPVNLENYTDRDGTHSVLCYTQWQIVNAAKRRGARMLPSTFLVREAAYLWVGTRAPSFEITFDSGATWQGLESVWMDFRDGTVNLPKGADGRSLFTYFWSDHRLDPTSSRHFWTPNGYRLIWAPYSAPITVRAPATGWSGTSYTVAGQQSVFMQYDEMLSVAYNRVGEAVTTADRLAQYGYLAQSILNSKKDIVYTGGALLDGIVYDFCRLNKSINLAAVDADGVAITTGWEAILAQVTDVEYDFSEMTTNVTFSNTALAAWGDNIDLLKQRLKIGGNVQAVRQITFQNVYSKFQSPYTMGAPITYVSGIKYTDQTLYYDPNTGKTEAAL
jgi:hypothetical protein